MNRHLLLLILLASCKANSPVESSIGTTQSTMSPGTALSKIRIIDYEASGNDFIAVGIIVKTFRHGAGTSLIGTNDTVNLFLSEQIFKSSEIDEEEMLDKMHTGKSMKMLLKEQKKGPDKENQNQHVSLKVLHLN